MQVAILAGGKGTRLAEETVRVPKALVPIGGRPILWHILRYFAHFGFDDFVIGVGYLGGMIEDYVADRAHNDLDPDWRIRAIDTGEETQTGGRISRLCEELDDAPFFLTWCDGLSTIDLPGMAAEHEIHDGLVTVAAVHPPGRFGELTLDGKRVVAFREKAERLDEWINGGVFVVDPAVSDLIAGDETDWDREVLPRLADTGRLTAFRHGGFWQCMDTFKDKQELESIWNEGAAPWEVWGRT